jgi:hypothetical protein
METRALAIAVFYAIGTGIGGIIGSQVFGRLVPTGNASDVFIALAIGAVWGRRDVCFVQEAAAPLVEHAVVLGELRTRFSVELASASGR